ncbi:FMN-dependent alpha-hydroxy acid dehydrogenase [Tuber magnatum]|uniref:FMN-dependent alpha-hydroxy acid dehydrogenase n=1 Tax=Tuber magnatum TaxID=42249 RepID=A0A317SJQ9_9PEZI|nr:FMN-dependent alpha-hydroxy acid dehydrogenase [Tuber magnatum]
MRTAIIFSALASISFAAIPFLNEPDTGFDVGTTPTGRLPALSSIRGVPDFEAVARHSMNVSDYAYYRTGAAGEFAYRRSLEIFSQVKLRPRILVDVANISLDTTVFGYKFSAPFFIAPAARAGLTHPRAELNLAEAAGAENILYAPSLSSTKKMEEIAAVAAPGQVMFHQLYVSRNKTKFASDVKRIEAAGFKGIFVTVDNPIHGARTRESRYGWPSTTDSDPKFTWESYQELRNMTSLPVIPKGIQSVEDALLAIKYGAPGIYISNHGARQLDTSQSPLEIAVEIHENAPEVFEKTFVFADGGVRYGTDVLKLMALGVKAVGLGRPFMYSNLYGRSGVEHLIDLLKEEIALDAANMGIADLEQLDARWLNFGRLAAFVYRLEGS